MSWRAFFYPHTRNRCGCVTNYLAEMWTAFGIMLGTAFNLAIYNVHSINWRLMFGASEPLSQMSLSLR
jgi:hypothetical protein